MEPRSPLTTRRRLARATTRVRRAVLRRRRLLAAGLTAVAAVAALRAVAPPPPVGQTLTVAAHDLPAGAVLTASDLRQASVPRDAAPDHVVSAPVGRALAAPLARGEAITEPRLVGAHLTDADPGTVAVPLRISDPGQVGLITVGDRIDLLATDPEQGTTIRIAEGAEVLAVPPGTDAAGGGASGLTGRLVVVAVPAADVEDVTGAAVSRFVTFAWPSH